MGYINGSFVNRRIYRFLPALLDGGEFARTAHLNKRRRNHLCVAISCRRAPLCLVLPRFQVRFAYYSYSVLFSSSCVPPLNMVIFIGPSEGKRPTIDFFGAQP